MLMAIECCKWLNPQTHLIIFAVHQGKFKAVFCWVNGENPRPALPVQTVHAVSSYTRNINGQIKCPDDAMITMAK